MATELTIEVPNDLDDALLESILGQAVESATNMNVFWYLQQWELGQKPPCCPKCAGMRYVPEKPAADKWRCVIAPVVLSRGHASCESVAAMHTGHKRAKEIRDLLDTGVSFGDAWIRAKAKYKLAFELTDIPRYFHVVSIDDGVRVDGTQGMVQ
jgi:hypothetical protein